MNVTYSFRHLMDWTGTSDPEAVISATLQKLTKDVDAEQAQFLANVLYHTVPALPSALSDIVDIWWQLGMESLLTREDLLHPARILPAVMDYAYDLLVDDVEQTDDGFDVPTGFMRVVCRVFAMAYLNCAQQQAAEFRHLMNELVDSTDTTIVGLPDYFASSAAER